MSNITGGDEGSFSSGNTGEEVQEKQLQSHFRGSSSVPTAANATNSNGSSSQQQQPAAAKKKRNLPGTPGNLILVNCFDYIN